MEREGRNVMRADIFARFKGPGAAKWGARHLTNVPVPHLTLPFNFELSSFIEIFFRSVFRIGRAGGEAAARYCSV